MERGLRVVHALRDDTIVNVLAHMR